MELAARQADVHLSWIEPLTATAGRLEALRHHFARTGRTPVFGLRTHLVVRDSEAEAWDTAHELIAHADPVVKAQRHAAIVGTAMVGQRAQAQEAPDHRLGPHLWNGLSEVRVNCGTAIVGTPEQVVEELLDYWKLGIDEFILSGFPHVEECHRVAGQVLPLLRDRIRLAAETTEVG
jgi:alkanesulfonate monooxygenase